MKRYRDVYCYPYGYHDINLFSLQISYISYVKYLKAISVRMDLSHIVVSHVMLHVTMCVSNKNNM